MAEVLDLMRTNIADMKKDLSNASLILETVSENRDFIHRLTSTAPPPAQPQGSNPASTDPTVWVVSYTATNWPWEIETLSSTTPIHGGKTQASTNTAPTRNVVGIYRSAEKAKEAGRNWVRLQRKKRLDAYDPRLQDKQARQNAWMRDWYGAEHPLQDRNLWALWIHRRDHSEELGVVVQAWAVDHSVFLEGSDTEA